MTSDSRTCTYVFALQQATGEPDGTVCGEALVPDPRSPCAVCGNQLPFQFHIAAGHEHDDDCHPYVASAYCCPVHGMVKEVSDERDVRA